MTRRVIDMNPRTVDLIGESYWPSYEGNGYVEVDAVWADVVRCCRGDQITAQRVWDYLVGTDHGEVDQAIARTITKGTDQNDLCVFEGLELIARTGHQDQPIAHERADRIIAALTCTA